MFDVYLIDRFGEAVAAYATTFDRLPQRTDGRYFVLAIDAVKPSRWLWIGRKGDLATSPVFPVRPNLERFAA